VRRIQGLLFALLTLLGAALPAGAVESVRVPLDAQAIDLSNAFERNDSQSDRLQVSTAPGSDGIVRRIEVSAREAGTQPNWIVFALTNDTEEQIERLIVAPYFRLVGSGENVSKLDFTKLGYTIGQPLTMINTDTNDTYKLTIANFSSTQLVASGIANVIARGANITLKYYDYENAAYLDSSISNTYTNTGFGTSPNDVSIDGGGYIDTYSSHAPEELIPGILYDSLNMTVTTKIQNNSAAISYRIVHNMGANASSTDTSVWPKYYGISSAHTTALARNLNITDSVIYVNNAAALTLPNTNSLIPGVVYINGEKIIFWTVDTINNTLGQIRRAVDGTGAPVVHAAGSAVVDVSSTELIPGGNIVHTTTWLNLPVGAANIVVDNFGVTITDNYSNVFTTTGATIGAVTDGLGLENSLTIPAVFIQSLK